MDELTAFTLDQFRQAAPFCARCGRKCGRKAKDASLWNATYKLGVCVEHLCPNCQTPEERQEAVDNLSRYNYADIRFDEKGRKYTALRSFN